MRYFLKILSLISLIGVYASPSFAVFSLVYDPYDVLQNTITAKNSVQSLINQAKQMQYDIENLKRLSKGHFENTSLLLDQLESITSQGQALSYGLKNVDAKFTHTFPGLVHRDDLNQDYANWSVTTHDTLKNAMLALSFQGKLLSQENTAIKELQALSENAQGDLSAQQVSHRLSLQEISQLQKLRQLMLTQQSTQNTFMAYQLQKEQSRHVALQEWIKNSQIPFRKYQGNSGFGANELPNLP